MDSNFFSPLANRLITEFEKDDAPFLKDKKISVNPIISRVASLYEKLRNVMDYREEEVVRRAAIERILKRRFLFGGNGKTIAEPLLRELVWARYFPDESISESVIEKIAEDINLYILLREQVLLKHPGFGEGVLNEWMYHLMSAHIENTLGKKREKEVMTNFMFKVMKDNIAITDDTEQTKDVQVFIAVHKSFAKDDLAFLRFYLFKQIFPALSKENIESISSSFLAGYKEIQRQLDYPRKDKILNYVKDKTAVFFILEDLLKLEKNRIRTLCREQKEIQKVVFEICEARYNGIASKIRRATIRSVFFVLLTKTFFALAIEGTFESVFYGRILWRSTLLNIGVPPLLMTVIGLFIKAPDEENSKRIFSYITSLLIDKEPRFKETLSIKKNPDKINPLINFIFTSLWLATFILAFGLIVFLLRTLNFNILSLGIFIFFLAIVSFLSYRINQSANVYSIEQKKNIAAPIVDFLFMPLVRVGRHLTDGISQLNIFLFVLDFIIETPFKGFFAFSEQWFLFLQSKREELG
ncbi:hypothetical protein C4559_02225 [Candidatus Microgenomates bacterium]|nr:MAG: hypothetical protein C4559_02225 [Candidatus Microgenomates bacterium]